MHKNKEEIVSVVSCHHCGDDCHDKQYLESSYTFCCHGCQMVYQLLADNNMSTYYALDKSPGLSRKDTKSNNFEYLDSKEIVNQLLFFNEGDISKIKVVLPQIHCSSCLWLLENVNRLNLGINSSRVNFLKKEVVIQFDNSKISLRQLVELLTKIGYEPDLKLDKLANKSVINREDRKLIYQIGLAGFVFGNIMLLSFPEYLGYSQASLKMYVGYINIILSIPVMLYCGADYIKSAWTSIYYKNLNLDVPIAIGMVTLFSRSVYEILSGTGEGYLDSLAGFIFFLLIGKWFQSFTYKSLDFERSYKSYFPISATVKSDNIWTTRTLDKIQKGDILKIRNHELIPTDGVMLNGEGKVDYSFVTGESDLIRKSKGDKLLAGGKYEGSSIEILVDKSVDQSYLTQLWNDNIFKYHTASSSSKLVDAISKQFTYIVIVIALLTLTYWLYVDSTIAFSAFTAVLIVACPCALALAIPFTYGNMLRILSSQGFFLKNTSTIEDIQDINHIVFDKTGTLTDSSKIEIQYRGSGLSDDQKLLIASLTNNSTHPLSKAITKYLTPDHELSCKAFEEVIGEGIQAIIDGHKVRVGSEQFIFGIKTQHNTKGVFLEIDGLHLGFFTVQHSFRKGIVDIIIRLKERFSLSLLSGDNDLEALRMKALFDHQSQVKFNQKPKDKLEYIKALQHQNQKVMMIGDGLNDAGALKQSNVGIVISDKANNFSPASDAIIDAESFENLYKYLTYVKKSRYIIYGAFALAFGYNIIGLSFAIAGQLSPVIAAILMPLSSVSVIIYGVGMSYLLNHLILTRKESQKVN